jgi:glycosyltransferase involved in cell wall biosynthesis
MALKKVLILITKSNWGGAQRHVYDVATKLPKDQYVVEVMAGGNGPLITKLQEAGITADGNLPVGRDVNVIQDIAAFFKLWSLIRAKKPDVLHVHSSKIGGLGALAGRLAGVKHIIFTAHGWAFNEDRKLASKILIGLSYWVICILSHRVMAVSEAMARQVRDWPFTSKKFVVVYNGIERSVQFSQANARHVLTGLFPTVKAAMGDMADKHVFWVGTVAELHHIKGHIYAIRAVREFITWASSKYPDKKIIYTIFGEGEERPHLEALIKEYGLENNVFLVGHTPDIVQYVQAFDVFMLASLSEGLAYVLLEAGLGHAPVIATGVGGIPEVVEDMHSGILVQPKKAQELAHALSFMMDHPAERKIYGNTLKDRVLQKFSLDKMMKEVMSVYEDK